MAANVEMWVPMLGTGTAEDPWRPDLPKMIVPHGLDPNAVYVALEKKWGGEFDFFSPACEPDILAEIEKQLPLLKPDVVLSDFRAEIERTAWATDEGAPTKFGDAATAPAVAGYNCIIREDWLPDVQAHLKAKYGKEAVAFADGPERDVLLVKMIRECQGDYDAKANAFFDSIPDVAAGSVERKGMVAELLEQAQYRGLDSAKVAEITDRLGLSADAVVSID